MYNIQNAIVSVYIRTPMNEYPHIITIVGCGPGAPDYLTPAAVDAAETADVVFGASRLLDLFPNISAETIPVTGPLGDVLARVEERASAGECVAVLVTGDPGVHSLARPVIKRVGRENCRLVAGVSSIQVAFAAVGCAWENVRIISAHHQKPSVGPDELRQHGRLAVLLGADNAVEWVASMASGLESHRCFLCEHLTLPGERVREVDAETLRVVDPADRAVILLINRELIQ